jgi:aldehyde dehydrogenase family 7 protein A1
MDQKLTYGSFPFLKTLGLQETNSGFYDGLGSQATGGQVISLNPHNNQAIAVVKEASLEDYEKGVQLAEKAKEAWSRVPMPKRGEIVRQVGEELRKYKTELGSLIALEMGKILSEGMGEVQEFIDMCDFACGLSRKIGGKIIPSERKDHVILEQWNPLGIVGVISAFNFPNAVFGWNFCISFICGNCTIWKAASTVSLVTVATTQLIARVLERNQVPPGVLITFVAPGRTVGNQMLHDKRVNLLSFTGSTNVGRGVSEAVHKRFGSTILELGGNNAVVVCDDGNLDMALKAVVFAAIGTAGQRCTSIRRLYIHESKYEDLKARLITAYKSLKIGDPLDSSSNCGPLHTKSAVKEYEEGLKVIESQGGKIIYGGKRVEGKEEGNYVYPTLVEIDPHAKQVQEELFCPVLYLFKFSCFDHAIKLNNGVPQGLSSSVFTTNMQNVFKWIGPNGSDCGLVNVNVGTSGAEIGGAFGGEKETGGGRESGSDAWKQYMRRATCTVNFGNELPLSQGIDFNPKL